MEYVFKFFPAILAVNICVFAQYSNAIETIVESVAESTAPVEPVAELPKGPYPMLAFAEQATSKDAPKYAWHEGIEIGTGLGIPSGFSFHAGYRFPRSNSFWKNRVGFRLNYNTLAPIWNQFESTLNKEGQKIIDDDLDINGLTISGAKFKADLGSFHLGALVDFHPFGYIFGLGGLRFTAGYYLGDLTLSAKISDYEIKLEQLNFTSDVELRDYDGRTVPVDISVSGSLDEVDPLKMKMQFNATGPYVGLGWDIGLIGSLHFTFDVGVIRTINPHRVSLSIPDLELPNNAVVEVNLSGIEHPDDKENFLAQLHEDGYCAVSDCSDIRNGELITIPPELLDQYKNEYSEIIDDLNEAKRTETNKAINENVNKHLKKYPYFPILRFGIMWRF